MLLVSQLNMKRCVDMYGLVFRDEQEDCLMFAVFSEDKETFLEVYEIDEDFNQAYKDIGDKDFKFVKVDMSNPTVAGFEHISDFESDMSSRDLIINCYDDQYPDLIKEIYDQCTKLDS